jgi:hypothetical protein
MSPYGGLSRLKNHLPYHISSVKRVGVVPPLLIFVFFHPPDKRRQYVFCASQAKSTRLFVRVSIR